MVEALTMWPRMLRLLVTSGSESVEYQARVLVVPVGFLDEATVCHGARAGISGRTPRALEVSPKR